MDQHSRSLALGKRTERAPSAASSTFHPHRPVPLPLRSFHPSPSPLLSNDAPSYASYSRPRRDSLSTSSPTSLSSSPVTPITPISPASPASPPRRIVSARSLRALRRRDIVHPTKFEGATVIGRYPPLSPACSSSEDELTAPSSVGTAASSVVAEHLNVGFTIGGTDSPKQRSRKKSQSTNDGDNELPFPLELDDPTIETGTSTINKQKVLTQTTDSRQHVHDAATNGDQERKSVHFPPRPAQNDSAAPRSSVLSEARSLLRLFSIRRPSMSTLKPSTSLRRIESGTTDSALSTSRPSLAGSRRRSASLPSPVLDRPRPGEIVDAQNTVDTILDIGAYNQLSDSSALLVTPLVTPRDAPIEPPRISSKEVTFDTSGASYYTLEVVVEETETPNKRNSMDSYLSTGTSVGPYRSLFGMFRPEDPIVSFSDVPRADSVTLPDLPICFRFDATPTARSDSPSSYYPSTVSFSIDEEYLTAPSFRRGKLLGPRLPFAPSVPSRAGSSRYSTASTALSGFGAFPFPPNLLVPTPPPFSSSSASKSPPPPLPAQDHPQRDKHRSLTTAELLELLSSSSKRPW
ncbi:hypothetical protein JCM16303_006987 [Sporobolomyces ruberrimus]